MSPNESKCEVPDLPAANPHTPKVKIKSLSSEGQTRIFDATVFFISPRPQTFGLVRYEIKNPYRYAKVWPSLDRDFIYWGPERIWTAVQGFADLCLTTRPQDLFLITIYFHSKNTSGPDIYRDEPLYKVLQTSA